MRAGTLFILLFFSVLLTISSCKRNINFNLPTPQLQLVIEGRIEADSIPYVIVTTNSSYYGVTDTAAISKIFVHGAIVKVWDGTDTVQLPELTFDSAGIKVGVYTNPLTKFRGQPNHTYNLSVQGAGLKVTAVTTIPTATPLDSIWAQYNVQPNDTNLVQLMCRFKSPPNLGEYVRYFTKRNNETFYPGYNSVFDDNLVVGTTFNFPLARGVSRNDTSAFKDYPYFYRGDTITVKWSNIDYNTFKFFETMELSLENSGPFSSPVYIQGNIIGGLGIWAGYNPTYKTLIVPK
jgi:hypothetical protein